MDALDLARAFRIARGAPPSDGPLTPSETAQAIDAVRELSNRLNHDRSIVNESYMDEPELLAGYVAFFLPRSVAQIANVLGELREQPRRVVDLGCGPGAGTWAALDAGAERVLAVDHARRATDLVASLWPDRVETSVADLETGDAAQLVRDFRADTVIISHVVNELWTSASDSTAARAEWLASIVRALGPEGHLIVLDPALRSTSRALLEVRDALVETGVSVLAPCLRGGQCPALSDEKDWCHAERPWTPPSVVVEIAEAVGIRHDVAKMTYFVFGDRPAASFPDSMYRIVSEPLHTKGRLRYFGCGPAGRRSIIMKERDAKRANNGFDSLQRGDVIEIGATIEKGDGFVIQRGERAEKIVSAGQPWPEFP